MTVGEPLIRSFATRAIDVPIGLLLPDGTSQNSTSTDMGKMRGFTFESTWHSGMYELSVGTPLNRQELFAVNVDTTESDLAKGKSVHFGRGLIPVESRSARLGDFRRKSPTDSTTKWERWRMKNQGGPIFKTRYNLLSVASITSASRPAD